MILFHKQSFLSFRGQSFVLFHKKEAEENSVIMGFAFSAPLPTVKEKVGARREGPRSDFASNSALMIQKDRFQTRGGGEVEG